MGVIIRQSFKSTIVNLVGALIGVISILYIYPLHQGANGFANSILYNSMFIATFVSFGVNIVAVRFFYEVKKNDHYAKSGFLLFLLIFILINFLLVLIFSFYFKDVIYEKLEVLKFNSKIFSSNEGIILFLSLIMVLINLLNAYASIYGRIVIPTLVNNLGFKIFLPILIILVYYSLIDYTQLSNYLLLYHMMVFVFLLFYLRSLNALDVNLKFMNFGKPKIVEMANFSLLTGLTGIGSFLSTKIDIPIISGFLGYEATGNYAIPLMMTAVMEIPNTSVISIASPILSKAWNDNNIKSIQEIYEKSSINLLLIGCFMFISVWFCFDSLSHLSVNPKVFEDTKVVFFVLGIAKLIDMETGVNNQIIGY